VLRKVGFEVAGVVEKVRRVYRLGKVTVCLDRVEGLGWFAEAEVRAGEPSQEEELLRLLRSMGGGESVRLSYLELLMGTL
ncbi:MAG: class IV adenylate cyclase, partial [Thermoplasmata archaeon]